LDVPNPDAAMLAALRAHRAGQVEKAEALYQRVLELRPGRADALHGLAVAAHQQGRPLAAIDYAERAVAVEPSVVAYRHTLGLALLAGGDPAAAVAALERAAALAPPTAALLRQWAAALLLCGDVERAAAVAQRAVAAAPDDPAALVARGETLGRLGQFDDALVAFRRAIELRPDYAPAHHALGVVLALDGRLDDAIVAFENALLLRPKFPEALRGLASIAHARDQFDAAADGYRKALAARPDYVEAKLDLARVFEQQGRREDAVRLYREALAAAPASEEIRYHLSALGVDPSPVAPPAAYVRSTFDGYAATFDKHLLDTLRYRGPQLLAGALRAARPGAADRSLDVLDLGCGTGLCGAALRPLARSLVGVDLSPAMVAKARERGVYDDVRVADLLDVLRSAPPASLDVVAAGDVLSYVGELAPVHAAAFTALRPGGLFAYTAEAGNADFALQPTRRYTHSGDYLRRTAAAHGYEVASATEATLRTEAEADVRAWVVVLRKP